MDWSRIRERLRGMPPLAMDVALTTAVLFVTLAWIAAQDPDTGGGLEGFDAFAAVLVGCACLPLVWHRRAPFIMLLIVAGTTCLYALADYRAELVVPLAVAAFLASAREARRLVVLLVVLATAIPAFTIAVNAPEAISNWSEAVIGMSALLGLPILLGRIVFHRRMWTERDRAEVARSAVAAERSRMARELHDVVAHAMGVMVVQAGAGRRVLERDPTSAADALRRIEDTGRAGLAEMRRLLELLPRDGGAASLQPQPGLGRLEELLDSMRDAGLVVEVAVEGAPRALPPGLDLTAYRVVQEALTNTVRHAGPARAWVVLRYGDRSLEIDVSDDGRGPPPEGAKAGQGIVGMRERLALFGGLLETDWGPSGGFSVRARLPFAEGT